MTTHDNEPITEPAKDERTTRSFDQSEGMDRRDDSADHAADSDLGTDANGRMDRGTDADRTTDLGADADRRTDLGTDTGRTGDLDSSGDVDRSADAAQATGAADSSGELSEEHLVARHEAVDFKARWDVIQVGFVDDPRNAVTEADKLVDDVLKRLSATFDQQHHDLEGQWSDGEPSTEDLRAALQKYRAFFQRLLAL